MRIDQGLADARAALPALQTAPADAARDRAALVALAGWCGRYGPSRNIDYSIFASDAGPRVERDGIWIDVTGVAHLYGGEARLMDDLAARLSHLGLNARLGLADTLGAAHALARFAVAPGEKWASAAAGETRGSLASLPMEGLRLAPETVLVLKRLGLRRIGQLYDLPRTTLERRFRTAAKAGHVLLRLDQALGLRVEPRRAMSEPPLFASRKSWPDPLVSAEALEAETAALLASLCHHLDEAGAGARRVRLSLYRADGTFANVAAGTSAPCRMPNHLMSLLAEKLKDIDAGFGIDVMVLEATSVERLDGVQGELQRGLKTSEADRSAQLVDRLANRLGPLRVTRLAPHASHIPERAEMRVPALHSAADREAADTPACRHAPRPPFLLAQPEPIGVMAEIPEGAPVRFTWRRVSHRVARAEGPERIAPEWWRDLAGSRGANSATRDYYRIEDESGAAYWVFRGGLYPSSFPSETAEASAMEPPRWFLHGLFA